MIKLNNLSFSVIHININSCFDNMETLPDPTPATEVIIDKTRVIKIKKKDIQLKTDIQYIIQNEITTFETKYDIFWKKNDNGKPSQIERYEKHNSPQGILNFIRIGGGPKMGITLEKFAREEFSCLKKRDKGQNTGYDHKISLETKEIYVEQKSSGHWGENDYKWQHIEEKHKWHILLLCGIDYSEIKFWVMNRQIFNRLVEEKKITNQGNKTEESSEGKWFNYLDVSTSLIEISTNEELVEYANTQVLL